MTSAAGPAEDLDRASARERLLDAAIHIAGREGLDRVTYRAVASRAGVAHGLVRHHFGSRKRLLAEALHRASVDDSADADIAADDLTEFAARLVEVVNRDPDRVLLQFDYAVSAIRGRSSIEQVRRDYQQNFDSVGITLDALGLSDPDGVLARVVFAAVDGIVIQHLLLGSDDDTEASLAALRGLLVGQAAISTES